MVAMVHENYAAPKDLVADAAAAIEELTAEFGLKILIAGLLRSQLGEFAPTNPQATLRVIQYVLREIVFNENPQLEAEIMAIGSGVLDEKGIMTRIGAKHKISRAAVSKRARAFIKEWGLPPSAVMKSEVACQTYSERNQPRL